MSVCMRVYVCVCVCKYILVRGFQVKLLPKRDFIKIR
jgi:hypothetical protein